MIQSFFPTNFQYVIEQTRIGNYLIHDVLFPDSISQKCPEVVVEIPLFMQPKTHSVNIRQPILTLSATLGLLIGMKCGYNLWTTASISLSSNEKRLQQKTNDNQNYTLRLPTTRLWAIAFYAFGLMNLSALLLHCLLKAPTTNYPNEVCLYSPIVAAFCTCLN